MKHIAKMTFRTQPTKKELSEQAFSLIDILQASTLNDSTFSMLRHKLLDLGNDILRLPDKEGD